MALTGVNLGGWLILERWMTPTLFEGTDAQDEYSFMQTPSAKAKLRNHQKTFITERDFKWLHEHHINAVRIPVGYWILHGDAPYAASIARLDWAFAMCQKYDLKVVLDIHGLPGSQNGRDHSGRIGRRNWHMSPANIQMGLDITMQLARRYADHPALWGIQVINEPWPGLFNIRLRRYYKRVYAALSSILPPAVRIIFSDAFTPRLMSAAVYAGGASRATMDVHWYHFGGPWLFARPWLWVIATRWHGRLIGALRRWNGIIIGEWSGCYAQRIFDKYPTGQHQAMVKLSVQEQMAAYSAADAWFYWSYKTEQPGVWNFYSLVNDGTITLDKP